MTKPGGRVLATLAALAAAAAAPAQPTSQSPEALREARNALVQAEDFGAALDPARRLVAAGEAGAPRTAAADRLILARIQAELELFDEAELNYLDAIDLLREADGELAASLVPAYRALARAYLDDAQFTQALGVLEQARYLSQRNEGLYNLEQSVIIDEMTLARLGLGDTAAAGELQRERLENAVRRYGEDDPRVVPFRRHLADYYERSRLKGAAREQHERNLDVQEAAYGAEDPRLLATLRAMLEIDFALGRGSEAIAERIEHIVEAGEPVPGAELSASLAVLGDRAQIRGETSPARDYYARAYAALERESPEAARETFGAPRMLDFVAPLSDVDRGTRNRGYRWGTVALRFDVSAAGRVSEVETVSIEPDSDIGADYARRVRETHFRPRLVEGEPAATRGVRFTDRFRYYVAPDEE